MYVCRFKPKEEPGEDALAQPTQVKEIRIILYKILKNCNYIHSSKIPIEIQVEKGKLVNKNADAKKTKQKAVGNRRSSIRSQNQNSSAPKAEYVYKSDIRPSH